MRTDYAMKGSHDFDSPNQSGWRLVHKRPQGYEFYLADLQFNILINYAMKACIFKLIDYVSKEMCP